MKTLSSNLATLLLCLHEKSISMDEVHAHGMFVDIIHLVSKGLAKKTNDGMMNITAKGEKHVESILALPVSDSYNAQEAAQRAKAFADGELAKGRFQAVKDAAEKLGSNVVELKIPKEESTEDEFDRIMEEFVKENGGKFIRIDMNDPDFAEKILKEINEAGASKMETSDIDTMLKQIDEASMSKLESALRKGVEMFCNKPVHTEPGLFSGNIGMLSPTGRALSDPQPQMFRAEYDSVEEALAAIKELCKNDKLSNVASRVPFTTYDEQFNKEMRERFNGSGSEMLDALKAEKERLNLKANDALPKDFSRATAAILLASFSSREFDWKEVLEGGDSNAMCAIYLKQHGYIFVDMLGKVKLTARGTNFRNELCNN